jgi:2-succinyl-5-enolpyruvyl-6-hydroxy-3-cyclohexene-1-carboxylate synthase
LPIPQPIVNIAEICAQHGVTEAILSPGSRCAPLTIAFAKHEAIQTRTISDERSAAFVGLGMAQYTKSPTVLICTSGSAAYNYAPAIAEAFFQHIPMIVLTADRPPEWIDQMDGQTIRQQGIYGKHIKGSFELPVDHNHPDAEKHIYRIINEAINLGKATPQGPVHINIPLREPFYPAPGDAIVFDDNLPVFQEIKTQFGLSVDELTELQNTYNTNHTILIIGGQLDAEDRIQELLDQVLNQRNVAVIGDVISNLHALKDGIKHHDLFLQDRNNVFLESLQPDLLITFGKSVIAKNLKLFLRYYKPKAHWHVQEAGSPADTYQSLTKVIRCAPEYLFENILLPQKSDAFSLQKQQNYFNLWEIEERKAVRHIEGYFPNDHWSELNAYQLLLPQIPPAYQLHFANSMAVRYANFIGLNHTQSSISVFANRGTSGIDGSNSTAMGSALASNKPTLLLTGDMAFFYDRNAFWHNYKYQNLKIIVFNNHGGGIFNMIKGPSDQQEYKEYFETDQRLTAKNLATEYGFEYMQCDTQRKLSNTIKAFFEINKQPAILEIFTDNQSNKEALTEFKRM